MLRSFKIERIAKRPGPNWSPTWPTVHLRSRIRRLCVRKTNEFGEKHQEARTNMIFVLFCILRVRMHIQVKQAGLLVTIVIGNIFLRAFGVDFFHVK